MQEENKNKKQQSLWGVETGKGQNQSVLKSKQICERALAETQRTDEVHKAVKQLSKHWETVLNSHDETERRQSTMTNWQKTGEHTEVS